MTVPVPNFPVPSFANLMADIAADLSAIPGTDVTIRMGVLPVLTKMLAKLAAGEYIYLANFPNRCLIPTLMVAPYLDVYCGGVGLTREAATPAQLTVTLTGSNGIPMPQGTQMQDSTGAYVLTATAGVTMGSGGSVTVAVSVTLAGSGAPSGAAGNLAVGAPVTLLIGIAGINANGVVASVAVPGVSAETDAALQTRLGARLSLPPQGGAPNDFVSWAKLVNGVTRVWVYPLQNGPGTVALTFAMDGRANPVPLTADVTNVQNQINASAPVIGSYLVFASSVDSVAVNVHNLVPASGTTLTAAQAAVTAAIAALNYVTTPGGYGWDSTQQNYVTGGVLELEQVYAAIANAVGVGTFDLTAPTADVTVAYGNIVQLAAPTFT